MTTTITDAERQELQAVWRAIADPRDPAAQALLGGVNLRLNVLKALKTAYLSAKLFFRAKTFAYPGDLGTLLGIGKDVFDLVIAALDTVRQKVGKAQYTMAVVLAEQAQPASLDTLQAALEAFLAEDQGKELPWYVGIGRAEIQATRDALNQANAVPALLASLKEGGLAEQVDGLWRFKPRHFTWTGELTA